MRHKKIQEAHFYNQNTESRSSASKGGNYVPDGGIVPLREARASESGKCASQGDNSFSQGYTCTFEAGTWASEGGTCTSKGGIFVSEGGHLLFRGGVLELGQILVVENFKCS